MKTKELEICGFSTKACEIAERIGATRVELCASPSEGGVTPSLGLIKAAREILKSTKLYVMIRPRGGDFLYNDDEFQIMVEDIKIAKEAKADGVVFGLLNSNGSIDIERTSQLVSLASPMKVTFHRAFDRCNDFIQGLEDVIATGCERILTSGLAPSVDGGMDILESLVKLNNSRIKIMAGSGVNGGNAEKLLQLGVNALHLTAKQNSKSSMSYINEEFAHIKEEIENYDISEEKCIDILNVINRYSNIS